MPEGYEVLKQADGLYWSQPGAAPIKLGILSDAEDIKEAMCRFLDQEDFGERVAG